MDVSNSHRSRWISIYLFYFCKTEFKLFVVLSAAFGEVLPCAASYVSKGSRWDAQENDKSDNDLSKQLATTNGYSQSKSISELLVKEFGRISPRYEPRTPIVRPGFIIGTSCEGFANKDDSLIRLAAGVVRNQAINRDV